MSPSAIEPATFRLVAQCPVRHLVPPINKICEQSADLINVPVDGTFIYHSTLDG